MIAADARTRQPGVMTRSEELPLIASASRFAFDLLRWQPEIPEKLKRGPYIPGPGALQLMVCIKTRDRRGEAERPRTLY